MVAPILGQPKRFPELLECLWCSDPVVRMRASDAAEKISVQRPELLRPFKAELLGLACEATQQEVRWHLALMIPRLPPRAGNRAGAKGGSSAARDRARAGNGVRRMGGPRDPLTLGSAVALLAMVALFASYGPAWRASRLQPMDALRDE